MYVSTSVSPSCSSASSHLTCTPASPTPAHLYTHRLSSLMAVYMCSIVHLYDRGGGGIRVQTTRWCAYICAIVQLSRISSPLGRLSQCPRA